MRCSIALSAALLACAPPPLDRATKRPDEIPRPVVDRLSGDRVRIRWPASLFPGPVTVCGGLSPDAIDRTRPLAVVDGHAVVLDAERIPEVRDAYRLYYEIAPASGEAVITSERRLPLRRPDNFRDLGGYETTDGRWVRWNRIYRSNDLSTLTRSDLEDLGHLGVRLVCDLRSESERLAKPDREVEVDAQTRSAGARGTEWLNLPVVQKGVDPSLMREKIRTGGITALGVRGLMRQAYRDFVTEHSGEWAVMLRRIAKPESLPTVLHCTAGKDRTGFASALILLSLGVSEETVFEDYLLTNQYREAFHRRVLRWVPLYSLFRTDPEDLLPLLEARPEYLRVSLDTIDELYGSLDAYLEQALGVTPARRAALRANLLR